jgi:class 3 adenylate cyclase
MKMFFTLIDQLNDSPNHSEEIKAEIWRTYGAYKAILALDMSGFSSTVRREGIISYLAKIRKMQLLTQPLITQHQGEVIKYEADNLLAVFDDCQMALDAAMAINKACFDTGVSIGLDYGRILVIKEQDCYGDTVNMAFKLGEDIAQKNEILITANIKQRLSNSNNVELIEQHISISGLTFVAYQVNVK